MTKMFVLSHLLLRKVTHGFPLYLGLTILAFEPLTLSLSRTALPEVPSLFFTLFAFTAICEPCTCGIQRTKGNKAVATQQARLRRRHQRAGGHPIGSNGRRRLPA